MSTILESEDIVTLADLLTRLGGVPLDRVRFRPYPGTADERDVIDIHDRENRLFELVEGVLVEKPMVFLESRIGTVISFELELYMRTYGLGVVVGADGLMRITAGLVRVPDVSVVLWSQLPDHKIPTEPIPALVPDLAVEVLSSSNTSGELARKVAEYFSAGCRCVWAVDPPIQSVRVFQSATESVLRTGSETVTAETVVPGFSLPVNELFRQAGL